jgi:capsular polysaccharide biosynthesis protein
LAKDLNDPPVETADPTDVVVRNGSSRSVEEVEYGVVDTTLTEASPSHTFFLHRARPYVSPGRSARNHWQLIVVFTMLGVLLGAAFGFLRTPTYTAESRLVVGKTAQLSNLASIPGLDAAGQSLAASYSRLVGTDAVLNDTAKRLGGSIDGSLSASPIPLSPVVLVEASAKSREQAVALAKAGSAALIDAVNTLNEQQGKAADDLLKQYQDADRVLIAAQINVNSLRQQYAAQLNGGAAAATLDDLQTKVNVAQTEVDAAQVKKDALAATYNGVFSPTALNSQILQRVGTAAATGNNRKSTLEMGVLVGLVLGGLLGLGLAVWIDLRARTSA